MVSTCATWRENNDVIITMTSFSRHVVAHVLIEEATSSKGHGNDDDGEPYSDTEDHIHI